MVEYRTDEERLSAIINFFNDYKKFFVWGSVGLFLIVLVFISVSNFRANQDSAAYSVYSKSVSYTHLTLPTKRIV